MTRDLDGLVAAVRTNCHISDAQHAGDLTLCTYLLEMRELYRWERGIALGAPVPQAEVGAWIAEREALWSSLEEAPHVPLPLPGGAVEPAVLRPPGDPQAAMVGEPRLYRPLSPLLWAMAVHGVRGSLLPELAGAAVYRVSPAFDLAAPHREGPLRSAVQRLRRGVASQREIAGWPGMTRDRSVRLLNALYLQAGLIVSRSHPAALGDSWFRGA